MKELELYIHIPFCVKKCAYCDFLSSTSDKEQRQGYINALVDEIRQRGAIYDGQYQVSSVFVGGGTPSILENGQITEIFNALYQSFRIQKTAEITMEVNPGTVDEEKLHVCIQSGINRLSIGLQSTDNRELKLLGRIHTYETFLESFKQARKAGFENINLDLISAIPGQTKESWERTLQKAVKLAPEHISAYSLIVEEGTPFYKLYGAGKKAESEGTLPLPDEDTEREIYNMTEEILQKCGYSRYEISNYAQAGYECRHNKGYWERKEYLGLGLGASSLIGHCRFHNTEAYAKYIEGVEHHRDIREDIELLTLKDEIEEFMFLGLRETEGVSASRFKELAGRDFMDVYGRPFAKMEKEGLMYFQGDQIALTKYGVDVSNAVFVEFLEPDIEEV